MVKAVAAAAIESPALERSVRRNVEVNSLAVLYTRSLRKREELKEVAKKIGIYIEKIARRSIYVLVIRRRIKQKENGILRVGAGFAMAGQRLNRSPETRANATPRP